jgi:DNA-binding transcriptional MerR regulator
MKLLLLSGRSNPSEHERAVAREKAESLMARHGVSLQEMRELYRREHGLPERGGFPGAGRAMDPEGPERLRREAAEKQRAAEQWEALERSRRQQAQRERAGGQEAERGQLRARVRAAILQAISLHQEFPDFFEHLAGLGIRITMASEEAMERLVYRWPPDFRVSITAEALGPGCDWPSLLRAGLRFDPLDPRHREARAMMVMK